MIQIRPALRSIIFPNILKNKQPTNSYYQSFFPTCTFESGEKLHCRNVEELVRVSAEQSQPSITSPLTEQQVSVQVLGHRSGYLKGFGIRKKSSLASSQNQIGPDSEVQRLRQQVAEFSQRTIFLESLVLQLAQRAGIDPNTAVGADGTSGGDQDTTSPGLNEH